MTQNLDHIDTNTFHEVLDDNTVVVVDFYADWCGPCKVVAPTIEKLADEYSGRARFAKLDVDESPAVAEEYGVASIPTLIIFKNSKPVDRIIGAASFQHYRGRLERFL
jgi:thioredoxin 1